MALPDLALWCTRSNSLHVKTVGGFRVLVPMQMLAKANRERLAVLLEEARSGAGGDERYAASLR